MPMTNTNEIPVGSRQEPEEEPLTCRGRNGYFKFDHFEVLGKFDPYYLSIYSNSPNVRNAPMQFIGDQQDIINLLTAMLKAVKAA